MRAALKDNNLSAVQSPVNRRILTDSILKLHAERINNELRANGAVLYDLLLPETHYLPFVIHPDEHIRGSVYGKYPKGRGVLIATGRRILFVDKKPLFVHVDEISFSVVGGVTRTHAGLTDIVTLHTPMGDYAVRTFNHKNASNFVDYVETRCLKGELLNRRIKDKYLKGENDDNTT